MSPPISNRQSKPASVSRDNGFHVRSLEHTNERAIASCTEGLIELGRRYNEAHELALDRM